MGKKSRPDTFVLDGDFETGIFDEVGSLMESPGEGMLDKSPDSGGLSSSAPKSVTGETKRRGRPRKSAERTGEVDKICFMMDSASSRRLRLVSALAGMSVSAFCADAVRSILDSYVKRHRDEILNIFG